MLMVMIMVMVMNFSIGILMAIMRMLVVKADVKHQKKSGQNGC
jgi:hypothetical protein